MTARLGDAIHQARRVRKLTLRQVADQVTKDDGTPISPQYLNDIELHHRVPTPHVLRELARVLELDADTLLATAGAADVVVREYLASHPEQAEAVIQLFRAAKRRGFKDWERLRKSNSSSSPRASPLPVSTDVTYNSGVCTTRPPYHKRCGSTSQRRLRPTSGRLRHG
jgi:transcriptional regulator with XRE-family HTH domain